MAVIQRVLVLVTGFISGIAAIILCISLGTEYWVTSDPIYTENNGYKSNVRYGLFSGVYSVEIPIPLTVEILMTCAFDKNVCAVLCGPEDTRSEILNAFYEGRTPPSELAGCGLITRSGYDLRSYSPRAEGDPTAGSFINCGVWICTIIFVVLSIVMGFVATVIAVLNTAMNPVQHLLSVFGLYIYNGVALFCNLMAVLLWGGLFADSIIHNVAIYRTLSGEQTSDELATLGYSYWILLVSMFLYCASISVLYIRQYLISKEPKENIHLEDNSDPGIYLY